jgi:predicted AAA+ superfamily ATPase
MANSTNFKPRHLKAELEAALASARIVNIVGPRQAGKTTFVRNIFASERSGARFVTLDDQGLLKAIENDPESQIRALMADIGDNPLIIDEAQRSKTMALAIKKIVDEDRRKGQFILTGSSNVFTSLEIADSLAGRMRTIKLWPMSMAEALRRKPSNILDWAIAKSPNLVDLGTADKLTRAEYIDFILRGGFPEIRELDTRDRGRQYRDYVDSVVDRDVADILRVRKTDALRQLIEQLAARTACETNTTTLSRLIATDRKTVDEYMDVLFRLSMIVKLRAWTSSESKRDIKQPKYHFADTGIVAALRQMTAETFNIDADPGAIGLMLESFVHSELQKSLPNQQNDFRLYHWRNERKKEIDILAESATRLVGIEIKAASTVNDESLKALKDFAKTGPGKSKQFTGIVFYLGEHKLTFGDGIFALPVSILWSQN